MMGCYGHMKRIYETGIVKYLGVNWLVRNEWIDRLTLILWEFNLEKTSRS